jgi:hypothetical protein
MDDVGFLFVAEGFFKWCCDEFWQWSGEVEIWALEEYVVYRESTLASVT